MVRKGIIASQSMKRVGPNIVTCWGRLRCEEDGWALLTALVIGHSAVYPLSGSILSSVLWRSQQVMHEAFHHRRCGWRQRSVQRCALGRLQAVKQGLRTAKLDTSGCGNAAVNHCLQLQTDYSSQLASKLASAAT